MCSRISVEPAKVTLLGSSTATEGQDLSLSCYATSSNPPVQIRWWLGHKELNSTVVTQEEVGQHRAERHLSNRRGLFTQDAQGLSVYIVFHLKTIPKKGSDLWRGFFKARSCKSITLQLSLPLGGQQKAVKKPPILLTESQIYET